MKPVYVDLHIHTSENPNQLNENYDTSKLIEKVQACSQGNDFLISLTDHNTINTKAYLDILDLTQNVLLGVELHIKNYATRPAYHCHIYFNLPEITETIIDDINSLLDGLYKNKVVTPETENIPTKEDIIRKFDNYDFMLLPHGGQSHSTFDTSIPRDEDVRFDNTLERNIYYNQFDGFTARSNTGLETTLEYFKRLGISDFTNLLTCSDNYDPSKYPSAKSCVKEEYIPTWIFAAPSFQGLRLSLSESARLQYSAEAPKEWAEYINHVKIKSENLDIDVQLSPGLNVVIGGSSSGKTLFVDTLVRKLEGTLNESKYQKYGIDDIIVINPAQTKPHYINQNYIVNVLSDDIPDIGKISMIKRAFPTNPEMETRIHSALIRLKSDLNRLISSVNRIAEIENELGYIPNIPRLATQNKATENIINAIVAPNIVHDKIYISEDKYKGFIEAIENIESYIQNNPLVDNPREEFNIIRSALKNAYTLSIFENIVRQIVDNAKSHRDEQLKLSDTEVQTKKQNKEKLLTLIGDYVAQLRTFDKTLESMAQYNEDCESDSVTVSGHSLKIQNSFKLNQEIITMVFNHYLKSQFQIKSFNDITPQALYSDKYSRQKPKVENYDDFCKKVYDELEGMNSREYQITTRDGVDFNDISPGWKCAVLIDIILGYNNDIAPIIIDQPEDNLATQYINVGLVDALKKVKKIKQVILVSHNATIPMLGDAQNIILCKNNDGKIGTSTIL